MSSSQRGNIPSIPPKIDPFKASLLSYDQIFNLLTQGLANFMNSFVSDKKGKEILSQFTIDLFAHNEGIKKHFDQYGRLAIKAAYPESLGGLTHDERGKLNLMGLLEYKTLEDSINRFFFKKRLTELINSKMTKEKYHEPMNNLVDAVYQFIQTANFSIEYEQATEKNPRVSALDLQLTNARNNINLCCEKIAALKTGKYTTEILKSKTDSRDQMLLAVNTAVSVRKSRQDALQSKKASENIEAEAERARSQAESAEKQKMEALAENERLLVKLREAIQIADEAEEAKRKAAEVSASIVKLQAELDETQRKVIDANAKVEKVQQDLEVVRRQTVGFEKAKVGLQKKLKEEKTVVKNLESKEERRYSAEARQQEEREKKEEDERQRNYDQVASNIDATLREIVRAKGADNKKALMQNFENVNHVLDSENSAGKSIVDALCSWEKAALSYIIHKPPAKKSALHFIGMGKKITPKENEALREDLMAVLKQLIAVNIASQYHVADNALGMKQCKDLLASTYDKVYLQENSVSHQFLEITEKMLAVAEARFGYVKPPRQHPMEP